MSQQTILRVQTNIPETFQITGTTSLDVLTGSTAGYTGTGTSDDPYVYSTSAPSSITMKYQANGAGSIFFTFESSNDVDPSFAFDNHLEVYYYGQRTGIITYPINKQLFYGKTLNTIQYDVQDGDRLTLQYVCDSPPSGTVSGTTYFIPNTELVNYTPTTYENLDLYSDIPIKINKSFAELQDIGKRNSDFSVNLTLPGSKKNNRFFETFYNVDMNLVFFDVTKRVPCDVLIEDQTYFRGYLKLNKINVKNSAVEYDVTLYSTVADIFGKIGNNLLRDLNFNDAEYHFNHQFHWKNIIGQYQLDPNLYNVDTPQSTFYPILHNGYNYDGDDVVLSGTTDNQTRLYTSSSPIGGYASEAAWISAGGKKWRINSPLDGIIDNQLKPALNIRNLVKLMFKGYGYTISSKFFETPWFKNLNLYGYFSSDTTKLSYIWEPGDCLPLSGVNVLIDTGNNTLYLVKKGTTTPVTCCETVTIVLEFDDEGYTYAYEEYEILPGEYSTPIVGQVGWIFNGGYDTNANAFVYGTPSFDPATTAGTYVPIIDNEVVDFSLMIDPKIKQIDFLSSLAKKFNLVFTPNPDVPNEIIIEPYDYYINSGDVHDWTEKLSYDKGFSVEPALNYIESTLKLTDLDDGDEGNRNFKDAFNRTYGEKTVFNTTDFKSSDKEIKTIFSPELIRTWDNNIGLPLGINYVGSTSEKDGGQIAYQYKGVKTKPKLFYWLGNFPPFADQLQEYYTLGQVNTNVFRIAPSNRVSPFGAGNEQWGTVNAPIISHTSTIGNPDENKINNDNLTILFGSEQPVDLGVSTFPTYTDNNLYNTFYQNRIQNIYDKNTRFLSGKFDLKLNDILNLKPNDLIKIQEQYFTWNKIKEYNMTDPELTQVELIQTNRVVKTYPDRYFIYQYCDGSQYEYKFKTYFDYTEAQQPGGDRYRINGYSPAVMSNYFWATLYDYFVGVLGGEVSGYTSCVQDFSYGTLKYDIREVTQSEWESSSADLWNLDPAKYSLWGWSRTEPSWENAGFDYPLYLDGSSQVVLNVATGCTQMGSILTTLGITAQTPDPPTTPLPVVTPTPTPTPQPTVPIQSGIEGDGSLIMTYSRLDDENSNHYYTIYRNTDDVYRRYHSIENLYNSPLEDTDDIVIRLYCQDTNLYDYTISVYRRDYTNDDQGGDMGIVDTPITGVTKTNYADSYDFAFTVETNPDAYNYEYRVTINETPKVTPTPTPTPTPEVCWGCRSDIDNTSVIGPITTMMLDSNDTLYLTVGSYLSATGYITTRLDYTGCPTNDIVTPTEVNVYEHILFDIADNGNLYTTDENYGHISIADGNDMIVFESTETDFGSPVFSLSDGSVIVYNTNFSGATINKVNADLDGYDLSFTTQQLYDGTGNWGFLGKLSDDSFITYDKTTGVAGYNIRRWNSDGTPRAGWQVSQTWFDISISGDSGKPRGILELSTGKILLFGDFGKWRQTSGDTFSIVDNVIRLEYNGVLDTGYNNQGYAYSGGTTNALVDKVKELSTGDLIYLGEFTSYNGVTARGLLKTNANGAINTTFATNIGNGFTSWPDRGNLDIDSNDFIYVGSSFVGWDNDSRIKYLLRLKSDGINTTCATDYNGIKPLPTPTGPTPTPFPTHTSLPNINFDASVTFAWPDQLPNDQGVVSFDFDAVRLILTPVYGGDSYDSGVIDPNIQVSGSTTVQRSMTHNFSTVSGNYQNWYDVEVWIKVDYDDYDGSFTTMDALQPSGTWTTVSVNGVSQGQQAGPSEYATCPSPHVYWAFGTNPRGWRMYEVGSADCAGYVKFNIDNVFLSKTDSGNTSLDINIPVNVYKNQT